MEDVNQRLLGARPLLCHSWANDYATYRGGRCRLERSARPLDIGIARRRGGPRNRLRRWGASGQIAHSMETICCAPASRIHARWSTRFPCLRRRGMRGCPRRPRTSGDDGSVLRNLPAWLQHLVVGFESVGRLGRAGQRSISHRTRTAHLLGVHHRHGGWHPCRRFYGARRSQAKTGAGWRASPVSWPFSPIRDLLDTLPSAGLRIAMPVEFFRAISKTLSGAPLQ